MTQEKAKKHDEFPDENLAPDNWLRFDNIGDGVKGTLMRISRGPTPKGDGEQIVYEMIISFSCSGLDPKKPMEKDGTPVNPGEIWKYGVNVQKTYVVNRLKNVQIGQIIGFRFVDSQPSKTKGHADAKSITPYLYEMDEEFATKQIKNEFGGHEIPPEEEGEINPDDVKM